MDAFERGVRLSTRELLALYSQNKGEEEKQKMLLRLFAAPKLCVQVITLSFCVVLAFTFVIAASPGVKNTG